MYNQQMYCDIPLQISILMAVTVTVGQRLYSTQELSVLGTLHSAWQCNVTPLCMASHGGN